LLHRGEGVLLAVEDARGPAVDQTLVAGELDDAPLGGEVPTEHGDAAGRLEGRGERADDLLTRGLAGRPSLLPDGLAGHRPLIRVKEAGLEESLGDDPHPARLIHL